MIVVKIAVFGSGCFGKQALRDYGVEQVEYFVDNNYEKWSRGGVLRKTSN